jgi:hypothetical protein
MTDLRNLNGVLLAIDGDAGCAACAEMLDAYVELQLRGTNAADVYPGAAIHLDSCPDCRAEHDGLLDASLRFDGFMPE